MLWKKKWFLVFLLILFINVDALAVELIKVPGGVVARGIGDFGDQIQNIKAYTDNRNITGNLTNNTVDYFFSDSDLCNNASYSGFVGPENEKQLINQPLNHLCRDDRSPLTFAFLSDTHSSENGGHEKAALFLKNLISEKEDIKFIVHGGDYVSKGMTKDWKHYRGVAEKYYSSFVPLVPLLGNHEFYLNSGASWWEKIFKTQYTEHRYYYLDLGVAVLVVLDSNLTNMSGQERDDQLAWLDTTLSEFSEKKPIIVAFHHAPYSSGIGSITLPYEPWYIHLKWAPLFEKYNVKLVLNGHEHLYERSEVNGISYLVAGPAGGSFYSEKPWGNSHVVVRQQGVTTVSLVTIKPGQLIEVDTFDVDSGQVIDSFVL